MAGRTSAQWSVDVGKPAEAVFAYLADVSKHGEWSPKPLRVEGVQPGPVSTGATFTTYGWIPGDKEHRNDVEVTEVAPPNRLVLSSKDPGGGTFVNTFTVTAADGGCRVEREMDMPKPGGIVGALFPVLLATVVRPSVQKGMKQLKHNLEAAAAG